MEKHGWKQRTAAAATALTLVFALAACDDVEDDPGTDDGLGTTTTTLIGETTTTPAG